MSERSVGEDMDEESPHDVSRALPPSTIRGQWRAHKGEIVVGSIASLVVSTVVGVAVWLIVAFLAGPGPSRTSPSAIRTPTDLREYLASLPIWSDRPTIFNPTVRMSIELQATDQQQPPAVRLNATGTDLETASVSEVAENGAALGTSTFIVVGRIRSTNTGPLPWEPNGHSAEGPNHDVELESPDRRTMIFGLIAGNPTVGEIVYFPALLVAVGYTRDGEATAFVVSLATAIDRSPTSGAIRALIDAYLHHNHF
jgi:hypothetical protein